MCQRAYADLRQFSHGSSGAVFDPAKPYKTSNSTVSRVDFFSSRVTEKSVEEKSK